jgi:hypothetical protein
MNNQLAVIELRGGVPCSLRCFTDTEVMDAEAYFTSLLKKCEPKLTDEYINNCLMDGTYNLDDYDVVLMWETGE